MYYVANPAANGETHSFLRSLDGKMKKWLTAADIRREIVTGLTEWFEQTYNTLEAAAAEKDADKVAIRMVTKLSR
jgi:hypothetical protein